MGPSISHVLTSAPPLAGQGSSRFPARGRDRLLRILPPTSGVGYTRGYDVDHPRAHRIGRSDTPDAEANAAHRDRACYRGIQGGNKAVTDAADAGATRASGGDTKVAINTETPEPSRDGDSASVTRPCVLRG